MAAGAQSWWGHPRPCFIPQGQRGPKALQELGALLMVPKQHPGVLPHREHRAVGGAEGCGALPGW